RSLSLPGRVFGGRPDCCVVPALDGYPRAAATAAQIRPASLMVLRRTGEPPGEQRDAGGRAAHAVAPERPRGAAARRGGRGRRRVRQPWPATLLRPQDPAAPTPAARAAWPAVRSSAGSANRQRRSRQACAWALPTGPSGL